MPLLREILDNIFIVIVCEPVCDVINFEINFIPVGIYLFKVNKGNTRTMCEIYSKLTIKTPERRHWPLSGVFIVNFEQISHIVLVLPLLILNK